MVFWLFQHWAVDSIAANLFRYISFRAIIAAGFSFLLVVLLMPRLIRRLRQLSVGQVIRDDGPQTHLKKAGTPTMGGVLMVAGITLTTVIFCRWENPYVWIALFSLLGFGAVGFWDDYLKLTKKNTKGVSFRVKMILLGLGSLLAAYAMTLIPETESKIVIPFLKDAAIPLGGFFFIWAFLVINGASNAVNLTDGLDGLAIVPIMTTAFVLLLTSYVAGHSGFSHYLLFEYLPGAGELAIVLASVIGVGLGFLWYNAHPAEVFMGDVGSLSLGGLLGTVALLTHKELVLFMAGFLFVLEAMSVILQVGSYKSTKKRIFKMAPLHHHFELSGWPESKVIARFWILSILFALLALSTLKIR